MESTLPFAVYFFHWIEPALILFRQDQDEWIQVFFTIAG